jgi:hypothetical protein
MTRRPAVFTTVDVRRACKAAPDRVVEIAPNGTIRLVPKEVCCPPEQAGMAKDAADVVAERLKRPWGE